MSIDLTGCGFSATTSDPGRVWVHRGTTHIGWVIDNKFVPLVSEDETNAMLSQALKKGRPDE